MPSVSVQPVKKAPLEPWPYQKRMIKEVANGVRMVCLPYGAGKSMVAINTAVDLYNLRLQRAHAKGLVAIICCRSHNIFTWQREWEKWAPGVMLCVGVEGVKHLVVSESAPSHSVLIVSHHALNYHYDNLLTICKKYHPAAFVIDESTKIKNPKAKRTQAAVKLTEELSRGSYLPPTITLALTGKPTPESDLELWSQMYFAYGPRSPFGNSYYRYCNKWFLKTEWDWALRNSTREEFYTLRDKNIVCLTGDDLDEYRAKVGIDRVQYVIEQCKPTTEQTKLLNMLTETWSLPTSVDNVNDVDVDVDVDVEEYEYKMALMHKAQQIASGFYYVGSAENKNKRTIYLKKQPKVDLLITILNQLLEEDSQRRIVIWHAYTAEVFLIIEACSAAGIHIIQGPSKEALIDFSDDDCGVDAILVPMRVSDGLNELVCADTNIFFSTIMSQEMRTQAEKRIDRPGQRSRIVTNIDLCTHGCDDYNAVMALQSKDLTSDKLKTIVNKRFPDVRCEDN